MRDFEHVYHHASQRGTQPAQLCAMLLIFSPGIRGASLEPMKARNAVLAILLSSACGEQVDGVDAGTRSADPRVSAQGDGTSAAHSHEDRALVDDDDDTDARSDAQGATSSIAFGPFDQPFVARTVVRFDRADSSTDAGVGTTLLTYDADFYDEYVSLAVRVSYAAVADGSTSVGVPFSFELRYRGHQWKSTSGTATVVWSGTEALITLSDVSFTSPGQSALGPFSGTVEGLVERRCPGQILDGGPSRSCD